MPYQFDAVRIFYTTGASVAADHNGSPYTNPDIPEGTVLAVDTLGDIFRFVGPMASDVQYATDRTCWPRAKNKRVALYRDHWRFVMTAKEWAEMDPQSISPYNAAVKAAPTSDIWKAR